jgi:hypothetical protein
LLRALAQDDDGGRVRGLKKNKASVTFSEDFAEGGGRVTATGGCPSGGEVQRRFRAAKQNRQVEGRPGTLSSGIFSCQLLRGFQIPFSIDSRFVIGELINLGERFGYPEEIGITVIGAGIIPAISTGLGT